ncbi:hypothetical protein ACHAWF_014263 [Thalassiosira exigua]
MTMATPSVSGPRVIGCGHLRVRSKSGNEFPAFLVRLPPVGAGGCGGSGSESESDDLPGGPRCYFWRTKRDFLLLDRSRRRHAGAPSSPPFPKKAYAKLCDRATDGDGLVGGPWLRPDDEESPAGGYCKLVKDLPRSVGGNLTPAPVETTDNFDPRMKKSLAQMDSFLIASCAASLQALSSKMGAGDNATVQMLGNNYTCSSAEDTVAMAEAWAIFCRLEDSDNLVVPSGISKEDSKSMNPATLGQYFASEENSNIVVRSALKLLSSMEHIDGRLVFLEPSCGDGRILNGLLEALDKPGFGTRRVVGLDIDPVSIEKAKERLSQSTVTLLCADFLSLEKHIILSRVHKPDEVLVVLGGPPYTPKYLPKQFILHSITKLNAEVVAFILPKRCARDADDIQKELSGYCYTNSDLANMLFSFEGRTVPQPSILQCWHKKTYSISS